MTPVPRRLLVSAGEPSGDQLAAGVLAELRAQRPELEAEGIGGPRMLAQGLRPLADATDLATMGFRDVLGAIPRHLGLFRRLVAAAREGRYAAALLVDYPGFHLRLGSALRQAGVPVIQYVAPQLWAWRPGRLPRLRAAADEVVAILPFEEAWFRERGLTCHYVGHPVLDRAWPERAAARRSLGIDATEGVLGIFPGSREREIGYNWPLFRDVGRRMLSAGHCHRVIVAGTATGYYPDCAPFQLHRGRPEEVLSAATAALVKSGSTTLEAAMTGTPIVVAYRTSRVTYEIARRLMTVDRISLVNLVAGEDVVPEFWHPPVSAAPVGDAVRPLLDESSDAAGRQRAALARVRARLGGPGAAARVASLVLDRVRC